MKKRRQLDWVIGSLRTLAALAGVLLLAFGAAPGALAAGTQQAAQAPAGETGTVIWGVVFALAALGMPDSPHTPRKDVWYMQRRYFAFPHLTYSVYAAKAGGRLLAYLVCRVVDSGQSDSPRQRHPPALQTRVRRRSRRPAEAHPAGYLLTKSGRHCWAFRHV